jgi:flavin-dependent dehydrogenase
MAYDTRWRSEIGRELETGLHIREGFNKLSDEDLNYIIRTLDDEHTLDIISKYGDMDRPSIVLRKLLLSTKAPRLLKLIRPMIKLGIVKSGS